MTRASTQVISPVRGAPLLLLAAAAAACGHEPGLPGSVAIAPITTDAVFVVNGASKSISVVDAASAAHVGTIALRNVSAPHHLYTNAARDRLLVADVGADLSGGHGGGHGAAGGAVLLLDARTGATLAARRLPRGNHNAAFAPGRDEIWTGQLGTPGALLVLGPGLEERHSVPTGDEPAEVTFSPDGAYAFVANGASDSVTVVSTATRQTVRTLPVGDNPVGAWPGNDGLMYVDNETGRSITAISASTLSIVRTYLLGFRPGFAATAANGELWVTDPDGGRVAIFAAGATDAVATAAVGAGAHAIAFSADGARAFVTNEAAGSLSVLDVQSRAVTATVPVGDKPNGILFRAR